MKRLHLRKCALVVCLILLSRAPTAVAELRKWNKKMQELAKTFSELVPELSDSKPITPASQKKLEKGTKKLLDLAHTINMGPDTKGNPLPPESDPSVGFISNLFEREMKHAYGALQAGHTAYAKAVLRTTTGFCIACHSRHDKGLDLPGADLSAKAAAALSPSERAELFAATRQFDAALDEFEKIAADPKFAAENPIRWGKSVHYALNLAVRVKNDPDRALSLMNKVLALPQLPGFYSAHLPLWKESIVEWKGEGAKKLTTEEDLYKEAMRLTTLAREKQRYPLDRSTDVLYLRSSAILHELLTKFPQGKYTAEAFLLAGSAYELLEDRMTMPLPQMYYEACIRHSPHTAVAEQCFQRYEQDLLFGYTGSGGTFLPNDLKNVLGELRQLAKRK